MDITTVADDLIVVHDGLTVHRFGGLTPATTYTLGELLADAPDEAASVTVTTLPRPDGELLCRIATVNDVHFGETEAGRVGDHPEGPIQRVADGEAPYPETMNRGAISEIAQIDPAAVFVKGDLSQDGQPEEWAAFERFYRGAFGDALHVIRGNHDAYKLQDGYAGNRWVEVPGLAVAMLDTVIPGHTTGQLSAEQLDWLESHAADAERVFAVGHHQQWTPDGDNGARGEGYFGLHPDASTALDAVCARQRSIIAYAAGHTHRHQVRRMPCGIPTIEVGCVKDFPGTWAEYRVYETAVMQVVHRISTPDALGWSERCRGLYSDFGIDYEHYALGELSDRCLIIPTR